MQVLLRVALLGVFAVAGLGLAVSFAVQSEPAESANPPAVSRQESPDQATLAADSNDQTAKSTIPQPVVGVPTSAVLFPPESGAPADVSNQLRQPPAAETRALATLRQSPTPVAPFPESALAPGSLPPHVATYHPLVANPLDVLQDVIERIQAAQQQTADDVSRLREELPRPTPAPEAASQTAGDEAVAAEPVPGKPPQIHVGEGDENLAIDLQDSDLREVLRLLSEAGGLNILASPNVSGTVSATLDGVDVQTALDAILRSSGLVARREGEFVFVGTPQDLTDMTQNQDQIDTRVYRPDYVTADELQRLITPLLSDTVGTVVVSGAAEVGIESNAISAGGDSFAGNEVVVVRDYRSVLEQVDEVVAQIDRQPPQVVIEAMILSVKLDDKNELGVDFELLRDEETIRVVSGNPLTSLVTAEFKEGLKIGFLDSTTFAFVQALETIGDTNVIATPRVMCLNKQRAEILIGSKLGYVSTTVTETAATQAVDFLEVGTSLIIRPFVASDGMIRMEVHPELSTGSVRVESGFTLPDKDVTEVTTNVMCANNRTVVIGGLIREDLLTKATQIPVLGNLPLVGVAFRQRTEEVDRRELIVLITPRLVSEPAVSCEGERLAEQFLDRRDVFAGKKDPIGRQYYTERYTRLANAAWAAGDADTALRYANWAIQFNALNKRASDLRREILAVHPDLERGVDARLHRGLAPLHHPHHDYSVEGWPWQSPLPIGPCWHGPHADGVVPPVRIETVAPSGGLRVTDSEHGSP